jgi:phage I-like protein
VQLADDATEDQILAATQPVLDRLSGVSAAVCKGLAIAATAGAEAVEPAIAALKQSAQAEVLNPLRQEIGVAADADLAVLKGAVKGLKAGSGSQSELVTKVSTLEAQLAKIEAEKEVDAAVLSGKLTPAQREWAEGYAASDLAGFKAYVLKAPVVVDIGKAAPAAGPGKTDGPDAAAMSMAGMFGNSAEDLKKYGC